MKGTGRQRLRRRARRALLQVLYEVDASGHSAEESLRWVLEPGQLDEGSISFIEATAQGVVENRGRLDQEIQRYAPEWPVAQLPVVDRTILRIAIYEVLVAQEVSPKIAINEAVELAKSFGGESLPRFVNGVLGSLMKAMAPEQT